MKKLFKIGLILCLILSMISVPAYAVQKDSVDDEMVIRPMYTYIAVMAHHFDINRYGKATAEALMNAFDADKLKVEVKLQQYNPKSYSWKTLKTWSSTEEDTISVGAGGTWYVNKGYLYRSVATGYVYVDGEVVEETEW